MALFVEAGPGCSINKGFSPQKGNQLLFPEVWGTLDSLETHLFDGEGAFSAPFAGARAGQLK